jgi:regulator of replication initiation timing
LRGFLKKGGVMEAKVEKIRNSHVDMIQNLSTETLKAAVSGDQNIILDALRATIEQLATEKKDLFTYIDQLEKQVEGLTEINRQAAIDLQATLKQVAELKIENDSLHIVKDEMRRRTIEECAKVAEECEEDVTMCRSTGRDNIIYGEKCACRQFKASPSRHG